jgi:PAS domain S-box-containing protein
MGLHVTADDSTQHDALTAAIAAEAARAGERCFQIAFDNAPLGMAVTDVSAERLGTLIGVNRAMAEMLGYPEHELRGSDVFSISHPDDAPTIRTVLERIRSGEMSRWQVEKRYRHADGHDVWVLMTARVVCDDAGRPSYVVSHVEDIADRQETDARLARPTLRDPRHGPAPRRGFPVGVDLESELRAALTGEEFRVHFQPSYDLRTGEIVAAEALVRWEHADRGLLAAGEFIDAAEESDLIVTLGEWVLRQACERAAEWGRVHGDRAPQIWVNIAARQLERGGFHRRVEAALRDHDLDPARLCLELTERQLLGTAPAAAADLNALLAMGVSLALDDFGTGYSGLSYLRRLRFSMLKLDRSFVVGVPTDPTDTALTASVIALSRELDLALVCEGVETEAQCVHLLEMGCTLAQGDVLHPPAEAEAIDAEIDRRLSDDCTAA